MRVILLVREAASYCWFGLIVQRWLKYVSQLEHFFYKSGCCCTLGWHFWGINIALKDFISNVIFKNSLCFSNSKYYINLRIMQMIQVMCVCRCVYALYENWTNLYLSLLIAWNNTFHKLLLLFINMLKHTNTDCYWNKITLCTICFFT